MFVRFPGARTGFWSDSQPFWREKFQIAPEWTKLWEHFPEILDMKEILETILSNHHTLICI